MNTMSVEKNKVHPDILEALSKMTLLSRQVHEKVEFYNQRVERLQDASLNQMKDCKSSTNHLLSLNKRF